MDIYDRLFCSTFFLIEKPQNRDNLSFQVNIYQALSVVLSLTVSHLLFIYSLSVVFTPDGMDVDLRVVSFITAVVAGLFLFLFVRNNRFKVLLEKSVAEGSTSTMPAVLINGAMILSFFVMATFEILHSSS